MYQGQEGLSTEISWQFIMTCDEFFQENKPSIKNTEIKKKLLQNLPSAYMCQWSWKRNGQISWLKTREEIDMFAGPRLSWTMNSCGKYGHHSSLIQLQILIVIENWPETKWPLIGLSFLNGSLITTYVTNPSLSLRVWHFVVLYQRFMHFTEVNVNPFSYNQIIVQTSWEGFFLVPNP